MNDIQDDPKVQGLKTKLEAKGWSKLKIATFIIKMTSVSMAATNNLCFSCKKKAQIAAVNGKTTAKYCWTCQKNYEEVMKPLLKELNQ